MLRQLFAVVLIALTVSPFTAPFSTCDLVADNPLHQTDSISNAKLLQDTSAIAICAATDAPVAQAERVQPAAPALAIIAGEARFLVLRL
jgi:hypothetical protein